MILPHTYAATLGLMILSLLCLASWANTFKLTGKWRFELFYFDFIVGFALAALIYGFTVGNTGFDGFNLMDDVMQAGKRQWVFAFAGGAIFNFGNMLLLASLSIAGMAIAFTVGMGLAVAAGACVMYFSKPGVSAAYLLGGSGLILAAVVVAMWAYGALGVLRHERLAKAGSAKSTRRPSHVKGVALALVAGLMLALSAPLVRMAGEGEIALGPYALFCFFAAGAFLSTFVFNMFFINLPVEGEPVELVEYFRGSFGKHILGFLGGALLSTGALAGLVANKANLDYQSGAALAPGVEHVGVAASYFLAQAAAPIAALWGLLVWREFRGANSKVMVLGALMIVLFAAGLALIAYVPQPPPA